MDAGLTVNQFGKLASVGPKTLAARSSPSAEVVGQALYCAGRYACLMVRKTIFFFWLFLNYCAALLARLSRGDDAYCEWLSDCKRDRRDKF